MKTYIFDGTFEGLLSLSVTLYKSNETADRVFPEEADFQQVLFEEVINVPTDNDLSLKAKKYIGKHLHTFGMAWLYDSTDDHIIHLANCLADYYRDRRILEQIDKEHVGTVLRYAKKTSNERHRMLEFVRFEELEDGVYLSEISPDADVLHMLGSHFKDRLEKSDEWMIYDSKRKKLLSHSKGKIQMQHSAELVEERVYSQNEESYQKLWKVFFKSISIEERENLQLQSQHVPRRYRKHMTEFR